MGNSNSNYDETTPCEGSTELNGEGASYRNAKMVSDPGTILKRRIRGALVPMGKRNEAFKP